MKRNLALLTLVIALVMLALSAASFAQVFVSVRIGPPALPVYAQPICPGPGYLWTPGYWGWNDEGGYYWVPGTWVVAPVGMLWTPGYWGWGGGFYAWHPGYWGPHVGFYGGINYGFGYGGVGFFGGEWRGGAFFYNRAVVNVNVTRVTNVYNRTVVVNNTTVNHVSFNGGEGGVVARPMPQEESAAHESHMAPLSTQTQHEQSAARNPSLLASNNHGRPEVAATSRPGEFSGHGVVKAQSAGAEYHAPAISPKEARATTPQGTQNGGMKNNEAKNNAEAKGNNNGFKPFTPPSKNNESNSRGSSNNTGRGNEGKGFTPPSNNNQHTASPMYHDKGTSGTNPLYEKDSAARPSSPKSNPPKPAKHNSPPPPKHESAPKEDHHRGR